MVPIRDLEDWQAVVSESEIHGGFSIAALRKIAADRGFKLSRSASRTLSAYVDLREG